MSELKRREDDNKGWVKRNWGILVFFLGFIGTIFGAGAWYNQLINYEPRIGALETKMTQLDEIKVDVRWIKDTMQGKYRDKKE